jgi:hypothetical protein
MHFRKLPCPAGLFLVTIAALGIDLHGFAIGNLGLLDFHLHVVAALEPFANHVEMQLAHAGEHHFLRFGVMIEMNRRVFFCDLVQRS